VSTGVNTRWLPDEDYDRVRASIPIINVDVLPYHQHDGQIKVGLISREVSAYQSSAEDPFGETRYAMIGGRIHRDETIFDALIRHLTDTLGPNLHFDGAELSRHPDAIGEYFPDGRPGYLFDAKQHSIGLTWLLAVEGAIEPQGEATDFTWFAITELPAHAQIICRQWMIIDKLIASLAS
jgi:8-oxo-dGTP pyrophosphatase MutT (NUDIX family)